MKGRIAVLALFLAATPAVADDQPQFGQRFTRNMVSTETGLPESFDPATGANVKWVAPLGTHSYATPVIAGGRVYLGTNNERPRDPRHKGDRAVLMCFDEEDGNLLWQLVIPKLSEDLKDPFLDWKQIGFCSPPTVEGDRAYTLTNRGEIVCLDVRGMANGNDGPYRDEAAHMAPRGHAPIEPGQLDGDIVWLTDLVKLFGVRTHDQVHGSILIDGDYLYVNSCNGVDNTHRHVPSPDAPSLVVLDKRTGKVVARDPLRIGPRIFHCTWSSPSLGEVNGRRLIFFGGPDGVVYAFEALAPGAAPSEGEVTKLTEVFRFDTDPTAPKDQVHRFVGNRRESPSEILGMPVFVSGEGERPPRLYVTHGGDLWWGKRKGWLKCIDPIREGDATGKALVWSYELSREVCSTPSVHDGLVFVTDVGGTIHCVDAKTGQPYWTHKCDGEFWASTLVADGKVYVGTRRGQFVVLAASKENRLLGEVNLGAAEPNQISGTAAAANGVLYVPTMSRLFALKGR